MGTARGRGPVPAQPHSTRRPDGQLVVQLHQRPGRGAPGVAASPQHRGGGEALGRQRLGEDPAHGGGVRGRVGIIDEEAGAAVVDQRRQPTDRRGDHRRPAGRRLERDQAEGLGAAGDEADVGGPVVRRQQLVGLGLDEVDVVAHAPAVGHVGEPLQGLLPVGAAGAAHHHEAVGLAPGLEQLGQGLDGHVGALERLDPPDEQEEATIERQAEGAAGLGPVAGAEERVVDPGRHDADARRLAAVERRDLLGLDRARGQDRIGAVDDGRLGLGPPVGHVRLHLLGHRLGLHPVERVERADQRQVQLVLDHVAGQPRQPVVGVHRGVGQAAVPSPPDIGAAAIRSSTPAVNSLDHRGQGLLGQDVERAGRDVVDPQARLDVDDGGEVGRPGPGEDVAGDAGAGQGGRQLAHVDVHAAAVTRAGLGQRRRVQREDGEPAHGGQSLPVAGKLPPGSERRGHSGAGDAGRGGTRRADRPGRSGGRRDVGRCPGPGRGRRARAVLGPARPRTRGGTRGRCGRGPASAPR